MKRNPIPAAALVVLSLPSLVLSAPPERSIKDLPPESQEVPRGGGRLDHHAQREGGLPQTARRSLSKVLEPEPEGERAAVVKGILDTIEKIKK